jgi:hypothetical protein
MTHSYVEQAPPETGRLDLTGKERRPRDHKRQVSSD